MGNFVSGTPNEAVLISGVRGTRVAVGSTTWRWWVVETVNRMPLQLYQLELQSTEAETLHGVKVTVKAIANVKVKTKMVTEGTTDDKLQMDKAKILTAAQQFLGKDQKEVSNLLRQALEGHQRAILGNLSVEQVFRDRATFSQKVREHVLEDLDKMGFELISYSIKDITDENGYMKALGATQTAIVKREAAEGEAKNQSEAQQKVAQAQASAKIFATKATREAHVSANQQQEMEVEADKSLEMRKAETALEVGQAKQRADAAIKTKQKIIEREIAEEEALRLEVEAQGQAKARLVVAEADAEKIRIIARAKADAIRARGEAEAANLRLQAEAYKAFGQAALTHLLISKLPEIAAEISKPLAQTDRITFVSNGDGTSGAATLTKDITQILGQLPSSLQAMTGFDLREAIQTIPGKKGAAAGATNTLAVRSGADKKAKKKRSVGC